MNKIDGFSIELLSGLSETSVIINECFKLFYVADGQKKYFINNSLYSLCNGDTALISAGDINNDRTELMKVQKYYVLTFSANFLKELSDMLSFGSLSSTFETKKITVPESERSYFDEIFAALYREYSQTDDIYSIYFLKLYILEILLRLARYAAVSSGDKTESNSQEARICEVCRHICNYYNESITLADMARLAYMSPTYFSKKFKKVTGFGFNEYLNFVRVKIAINMLVQTNHSITEIAVYCGYQDSNYFGDVFRRIIGVSPSKYRKTHPRTK